MKITPRQYAELLYAITRDKKKKEAEDNIKRFVQLLVSRRSIKIAPSIIRIYEEVYSKKTRIPKIKYWVNQSLSEGIKKSLKNKFGQDADIKENIDETLVDGIKIQINDKVYDASIKNQLKQIARTLTK